MRPSLTFLFSGIMPQHQQLADVDAAPSSAAESEHLFAAGAMSTVRAP
jgi:hypothetical protein